MVERVNRTVVPVIAALTRDGETNTWDEEIKTVERNLNVAINKTTGRSPFELLYGYKPTHVDGALQGLTDIPENQQVWTDPRQLQDEARIRIAEEQRKAKVSVGEVVFMRRAPTHTGVSTKLQPKYRGPLVITDVLPSDTYKVVELSQEEGYTYASTAHASQLKPWRLPDPEDSSEDETPDVPEQQGTEANLGETEPIEGEAQDPANELEENEPFEAENPRLNEVEEAEIDEVAETGNEEGLDEAGEEEHSEDESREHASVSDNAQTLPRRSARERRPPNRFSNE